MEQCNPDRKQTWQTDFLISAVTGSLNGATNVVIGQPLDTIKTKMQAQGAFSNKNQNFSSCLRRAFFQDGFVGLYKGSLPAFLGSILFRSVQWAIYDGAYSLMDNDICKTRIPYTGDLQLRVLFASVAAGTSRALVECPFEYVKVRRQIGQNWSLKDIYRGFGMLWAKDVPLFIVYFFLIDSLKRHTNAMQCYTGIFFGTGACATIAYASIWPIETLKNQIQAESGSISRPLSERISSINQSHGKLGLYRGMVPGMISTFLRSGAAFVSMVWAQKQIAYLLD